ncbi:MAG: hypothetical protein ABSG95_14055 [Solirubrobacteraceae bacterium]
MERDSVTTAHPVASVNRDLGRSAPPVSDRDENGGGERFDEVLEDLVPPRELAWALIEARPI